MADQLFHHDSSVREVIAGGVVVLVRQLVKAAPTEAPHVWFCCIQMSFYHAGPRQTTTIPVLAA